MDGTSEKTISQARVKNESAPDSVESWDARRTALPRVCSQPLYVLVCTVGMAPTCYEARPNSSKGFVGILLAKYSFSAKGDSALNLPSESELHFGQHRRMKVPVGNQKYQEGLE